MLALDRDAGFLQLEAHFVADVLQACPPARPGNSLPSRESCNRDLETLRARCSNVLRCCRPRWKERVAGVAETHFVENEKLRFRSEERRVGDAGALQIGFRFFGDAARIAIVRLARDRIDDRADETERRLGVEDVDPGRRRIGNDEHVAKR